MQPSPRLHSDGIGRWFRASLMATIFFMGVFTLITLIQQVLPAGSLAGISAAAALFGLLFMLLMAITFIVWAYKLHRDFRETWIEYPISPGGAVARLIVPGYNIWGYWNIWKTTDAYLPVKPGARSVGQILPWFYGAFLAARVFGRTMGLLPESPLLDLVANAADVIMYVTLYMVYEAVTYGIRQVRGH